MMDLKRQAARLIYPYGGIRRVLRGPGRGMQFVVEPGIGFSYAVAAHDAVSPRLQERVKRGMTVYDVGANKGQMTLLFAARVGGAGHVLSFEPVPGEFRSLKRNVELNRLGHVRLYQAAVAEEEGTAVFTYAPDRPTQGKLRDVETTYVNEGADEFEVATVSLDDVLADGAPPPAIVKIDVEGAAASVLRGAAHMLDEVEPDIYIELHGPDEQDGVRNELLARGYVAETMAGERVEDPTVGPPGALWCSKRP